MAGDAIPASRPLASFEGLELAVPECAKGLGSVILNPESADLIEGVRADPFPIHPDDRGYFLEVQRLGGGLTRNFPLESTQVSAAVSYPDTIKAFHFHLRQTDCWVPSSGMFQVALADLRTASPTFGRRNTFYVGRLRPWRILIPPGVAHGYKIIGGQEAMLVYLTDRFYDPRDEGRIAYNDRSINYDWEMQHK
jgi:dTDP-4-dehydrorhamnose 3,5-epimerase